MFNAIKAFLITHLRGQFVKLALKKILGTAAGGGFKVWLVKFLAKEFYDEIALPLAQEVMNTAGYIVHRKQGKVYVKDIREAQANNDEDSYDDSLDNVFN